VPSLSLSRPHLDDLGQEKETLVDVLSFIYTVFHPTLINVGAIVSVRSAIVCVGDKIKSGWGLQVFVKVARKLLRASKINKAENRLGHYLLRAHNADLFSFTATAATTCMLKVIFSHGLNLYSEDRVRTTALVIEFRLRVVPIELTLIQELQDILNAMYCLLSNPSDEEILILGILNEIECVLESALFLPEKVIYLFVIYFYIGAFHKVRSLLVFLDLLEKVVHGMNQNARLFSIVSSQGLVEIVLLLHPLFPKHGESFSAACLSINEDRSVNPLQRRQSDPLDHLVIDLRVRCAHSKALVYCKSLNGERLTKVESLRLPQLSDLVPHLRRWSSR
jgi:hypothetical protein